jgi:L-lactate dehydrogenase complex protein LldG
MATETVANSARTEILRRIRAAKGGTSSAASTEAGWAAIERKYKRVGSRSREDVLALLVERLRDYEAHVMRVRLNEIASTVARMMSERGVRRVVVPAGLKTEWLPSGFEFVFDSGDGDSEDDGLTAVELDAMDGVMTGATVAIAETGTVVVQNTAGEGRRAVTLVPDYHLCVVQVKDVVETVPEAMERLKATATLATTFVSGPSATADIEMTRIKGVHGPRFLDVILAG